MNAEHLSAPQAHAIVAFAIQQCDGEPDHLLGLITTAGPIIVAVAGEVEDHYDFMTDHVADAVNWLVSQDAPIDREAATHLTVHLMWLRREVQAFRDHMTPDNARRIADAAETLLAPFDFVDDPPTGQEPLPFPAVEEPRCDECEKPVTEHNYDCTKHPEPR